MKSLSFAHTKLLRPPSGIKLKRGKLSTTKIGPRALKPALAARFGRRIYDVQQKSPNVKGFQKRFISCWSPPPPARKTTWLPFVQTAVRSSPIYARVGKNHSHKLGQFCHCAARSAAVVLCQKLIEYINRQYPKNQNQSFENQTRESGKIQVRRKPSNPLKT